MAAFDVTGLVAMFRVDICGLFPVSLVCPSLCCGSELGMWTAGTRGQHKSGCVIFKMWALILKSTQFNK